MALVITKTKIQVYAISAGQLGNEALAKIDLQSGASVIMAEWAKGYYVANLEKVFHVDGAEVSYRIKWLGFATATPALSVTTPRALCEGTYTDCS